MGLFSSLPDITSNVGALSQLFVCSCVASTVLFLKLGGSYASAFLLTLSSLCHHHFCTTPITLLGQMITDNTLVTFSGCICLFSITPAILLIYSAFVGKIDRQNIIEGILRLILGGLLSTIIGFGLVILFGATTDNLVQESLLFACFASNLSVISNSLLNPKYLC